MVTGRNKQRTVPSATGLSTAPVDLFILAGLPNARHGSAEQCLKKLAGANGKVIGAPSGNQDGRLYPPRTVETLMRSSSQFAIRRIKTGATDQPPRPRLIALLYVPSPDADELLEAFDFFVFPVALRELSEFRAGRQQRHNSAACELALKDAYEAYSLVFPSEVQRRVGSRQSAEALLLPPRNFHLQGGRLEQLFRELTRGVRPWARGLREELTSEIFDSNRLPGFLRPGERQSAHRDERAVVFPCARATEMHGRPAPLESESSRTSMQDFLRSAFRFGVPLPEGFHHDAQREGGRNLAGVEFQCSSRGSVRVTGTHANIYPNDYVRE